MNFTLNCLGKVYTKSKQTSTINFHAHDLSLLIFIVEVLIDFKPQISLFMFRCLSHSTHIYFRCRSHFKKHETISQLVKLKSLYMADKRKQQIVDTKNACKNICFLDLFCFGADPKLVCFHKTELNIFLHYFTFALCKHLMRRAIENENSKTNLNMWAQG